MEAVSGGLVLRAVSLTFTQELLRGVHRVAFFSLLLVQIRFFILCGIHAAPSFLRISQAGLVN